MKYTPKKAAMVILDTWLNCGGTSPWYLHDEEMEDRLSDYEWKVTEKRREDILKALDKIIEPFKNRISQYIEGMN